MNQNYDENLTETLIEFNITDGSNQRIIMTADEATVSGHFYFFHKKF